MIKLLLQLLALFLNALAVVVKSEAKPIPLCHVYGRYGLNSPAFVGHNTAPSVTTNAVSSILTSQATGNGNITSTGGANATVRGFCYVVGEGTPTIANSVVSASGSFGTGAYSLNITGLTPGTLYSVRAYATNSAGTGYGATVTVTTTANIPPTVTLNTADETEFTTDTPTVEFTGTDPEGNRIRYNVQIDTVATFDSQENIEIAQEIVNVSSGATDVRGGSATTGELNQCVGQTITTNEAIVLISIDLNIFKFGLPTDDLNVYIRATSDTGAILGTATINCTSLTTTPTEFNLVFTEPVTLSASTTYYITIERSGTRDTSNFPRLAGDNGNNYYTGGSARKRGNNSWSVGFGSTTSADADLFFRLYGAPVSILNKVSNIDAGFSNTVTPADTNPFNSGEKVSYTVQAGDALENGTYFWRVRGLDPSGTNTYGAWSAVRSFTVNSVTNLPPTVVLDIPNETIFTLNRPQLLFTGTDPDGDVIKYQLQVIQESAGVPATVLPKETFESGVSPWAFDSVNTWGLATLALDTTSKVEGANAIAIGATGEGAGYLLFEFPTNLTEVFIRVRVRFSSGHTFPTASYHGFISLLDIDNANATSINIEDYGNVQMTLNGGGFGYTALGAIVTNQVVDLQFRIVKDTTNGLISVWINNDVLATPTYTSGGLNTGTAVMRRLRIGQPYTPGAHSTFYIDDVAVSESFILDNTGDIIVIDSVTGVDSGFKLII